MVIISARALETHERNHKIDLYKVLPIWVPVTIGDQALLVSNVKHTPASTTGRPDREYLRYSLGLTAPTSDEVEFRVEMCV